MQYQYTEPSCSLLEHQEPSLNAVTDLASLTDSVSPLWPQNVSVAAAMWGANCLGTHLEPENTSTRRWRDINLFLSLLLQLESVEPCSDHQFSPDVQGNLKMKENSELIHKGLDPNKRFLTLRLTFPRGGMGASSREQTPSQWLSFLVKSLLSLRWCGFFGSYEFQYSWTRQDFGDGKTPKFNAARVGLSLSNVFN